MIKDGFGQSYLFDNHWSATVMDGKEKFYPSLLPPHNHGSLFSSHLIYFPRLSSRSRLNLKEKYQIELKLLTHPKQRPVHLKNQPPPSDGHLVMWVFHASGATSYSIMLKCLLHYWWSHQHLHILAMLTHLEGREKALQHYRYQVETSKNLKVLLICSYHSFNLPAFTIKVINRNATPVPLGWEWWLQTAMPWIWVLWAPLLHLFLISCHLYGAQMFENDNRAKTGFRFTTVSDSLKNEVQL